MPTPHLALALAALSLAAGCASQAPSVCAARGGPPWRELSTGAVTLQTDLGAGPARELAVELDRLVRSTAAALGVPPVDPASPVKVIAFHARPSSHLGATNTRSIGFLAAHGDRPIVLYGGLGPGTRPVFAHSVAHELLARAGIHRLRWFVEGSAVWAQSLGNDGLGASPEVGGIPVAFERNPRNRDPWAQRVYVLSLFYEGVSTSGDSPFTRGDAPVELSWRLVHLVRARHAPEVQDLQARLARGEEPGQAWASAFPRWSVDSGDTLAALEAAVLAYVPESGEKVLTPVPAPVVTERTLPPSAVHTLRLLTARELLPDRQASSTASLAAEASEALEEEPGHVAALWTLALQRRADAPSLAARAVEAHPEDPLAWRLAALAAQAPPARDEALRRALTLASDDPTLLGELSTSLAAQGKLAEAFPLAERRVAAARGDAAAHGALGLLHAALGRCNEAQASLRDAAALLPAFGRDAALKLLRVRVEGARRSCPTLVVFKGART